VEDAEDGGEVGPSKVDIKGKHGVHYPQQKLQLPLLITPQPMQEAD